MDTCVWTGGDGLLSPGPRRRNRTPILRQGAGHAANAPRGSGCCGGSETPGGCGSSHTGRERGGQGSGPSPSNARREYGHTGLLLPTDTHTRTALVTISMDSGTAQTTPVMWLRKNPRRQDDISLGCRLSRGGAQRVREGGSVTPFTCVLSEHGKCICSQGPAAADGRVLGPPGVSACRPSADFMLDLGTRGTAHEPPSSSEHPPCGLPPVLIWGRGPRFTCADPSSQLPPVGL